MRALRGPADRKVEHVRIRPAAAKDTEAPRDDTRGEKGLSAGPGEPRHGGTLAGGSGAGLGNAGSRDPHHAAGPDRGADMASKQYDPGGEEYRTDESAAGSGYPKYPAPSTSGIHLPSMSRGLHSPSDLHHDAPHGHAGADHRGAGGGNFGETGGGNLGAAHSQKSVLARAKDTLIHGSRASYREGHEDNVHLPDSAKGFRLLKSPSDLRSGEARSNVGPDRRANPGMNFPTSGQPSGKGRY